MGGIIKTACRIYICFDLRPIVTSILASQTRYVPHPSQIGLRVMAVPVHSLYGTSLATAAVLWITLAHACAEPLSVFMIEQVAASAWTERQGELCLVAPRQIERRYHLPRASLVSMALAESGRPIKFLAALRPRPGTINADGTGLFLDSKAAAISWVQDEASGHNFVDVGCMQVNLHYRPDAFGSMDKAFDPDANADFAVRLLLQFYQGEAAGSWDPAVGHYHSHTRPLAADFRDRVAVIGAGFMRGIFSGSVSSRYSRATDRNLLRPIVDGNKSTLLGAGRVSSLPGHRHFGAIPWKTSGPISYAGNVMRIAARSLGSDNKRTVGAPVRIFWDISD
jgi:hypothetical protein